MMAIITIAHNTFLESVRRLELILFLLLGTLLAFSVCYLSTNEQAINTIIRFMGEQSYVNVNTPGGIWDTQQVVVKNILSYLKASGMFFSETFTLIIAFAMTLFLIPGEIASGSVFNILPKPVRRFEYILGKFFGVFVVVTLSWFVMGFELFIFFLFREGAVDTYLLTAILLLPLKFGIFIAFMLALTTRLPSIFGGIISLGMFLGGHISSKIQDLYTDPEIALHGILRYLAIFTYYVIPHLHPVFSGTIMDPDQNVLDTWTKVAVWGGYAILYTVILLLIAIFSFQRKSL